MGDHYAIYDEQEMDAQKCLNVYCFELTSGVTTAENVAQAFHDDILFHMKDMQNINVMHTITNVINLNNLADFFTAAPMVQGNVTGEALPPYCAFSIFFPRLTRASRNGWKRLCGVSESQQANGTLNSAAVGNLQAIAAFIDAGLVDPVTGATLTHKLWRREKRDPSTGAITVVQAFFPIGNGVAQEKVSTQNTRKFGRGS